MKKANTPSKLQYNRFCFPELLVHIESRIVRASISLWSKPFSSFRFFFPADGIQFYQIFVSL